MKLNNLPNYLMPRIRDILFLLLFSAAMAAGWRTLNTDGDLPRHLLMGQTILETHSIPQSEPFSYVYEGRAYVAHEWLADVIYFISYAALGLKGVVFLTALLISLAFLVLYLDLSRQYEDRLWMAFVILWGAANTFQHWIARPHLFTILFLAVWLVLIDGMARGNKMKFWLPPLVMLLWGNIHAEFVAGFLVMIAYMAGWVWDFLFDRQNADPKTIRSLSLVFVLSFLATLINPFGLRTWTTILSYAGNTYLMSTISETKAPNFSSPAFFIELSLIVASIAILALRRSRLPSGQAFLLTGFTVLAMTSGRNIHLYGVVAPFVLAGPLIEITATAFRGRITFAIFKAEKQLKGIVWPVATVLIFLAALAFGAIGKSYYLDPELFPVNAIHWLEENPQDGRMFNDFKWGGYIVWKLWPEQKDFIDSQTDQTGEATRLYKRVEHLEDGWQNVLETYDVQWAILPVDSILATELSRSDWKTLYQDDTAIILRKK